MILILILLTIPLIISLFTYAFFWYETANSAHRQYLANLTEGKLRWLLLKGILSSYFSLLLTALLYPTAFWHRRRPPPLQQDCPRPPVVLVHGLYHNISAWTLYQRWLRAAGFSNIFFLGYSSWNQTVADLKARLEQLLAQVHERFPDHPPVVVGHSLGGVLARACAQAAEGAVPLAGVITLGAPHQGSKLAAFGLGKLAQSLLYRSAFVDALESWKGRLNLPCIALYSPIDNMVLPHHALQTSEPGWVHQETAPISHVAMLYHQPTAMLVVEYLKSMGNGGN